MKKKSIQTVKVKATNGAKQHRADKKILLEVRSNPILKDLWSIIGHTPEALMLLDRYYNIVLYNKKAQAVMQKFTGNTISINQNLISVLPVFRREDVTNKLEQVSNGNSVDYEVEYHSNNWLRVSFQPIKNSDGIVHEICLTIRDVTGYKSI